MAKVAEALTAAVRNSTYLETEKNNTKGKTKSIVDKTLTGKNDVSKKELFNSQITCIDFILYMNTINNRIAKTHKTLFSIFIYIF